MKTYQNKTMKAETRNILNSMTVEELKRSLKTLKNWDELNLCDHDQLERIQVIEQLLIQKGG